MAVVLAVLRQEIREAVASLNSEHISAAIAKVAATDPQLAESLRGLADRLAYTAIFNALAASLSVVIHSARVSAR